MKNLSPLRYASLKKMSKNWTCSEEKLTSPTKPQYLHRFTILSIIDLPELFIGFQKTP